MYLYLLLAATSNSTVYGFGEYNCGDVGKPVPCADGAITASGERFKPKTEATAAIPMPANRIMRPTNVWLRHGGGSCVRIRINDKANPRYIGRRGFDLSPKAVELLTGKKATTYWSGKVILCDLHF